MKVPLAQALSPPSLPPQNGRPVGAREKAQCPQGWRVEKNWTVDLNHAVDNEGQCLAHRLWQEGLELPGSTSDLSPCLKAAKLPGGWAWIPGGSPASGEHGLHPFQSHGPQF